jgi:hypothetical protein
MNRFFDIDGDVSTELAPWKLRQMKRPVKIALFQLQVALRFRSDIAKGIIVVPQNYLSDLASISQFAWSIFMADDDPRIELGAWIHDLLYQNHGVVTLGRRKPDELVAQGRRRDSRARSDAGTFRAGFSMRRRLSLAADVWRALAGRAVLEIMKNLPNEKS